VTEDAAPPCGGGLPVHRYLVVDGRAADKWDARIDQLLPYQVNGRSWKRRATRGEVPSLPPCAAQHRDEVGRQIFATRGLDGLEVTEEVFESTASIVFDQAENRLHTIKAVMVATLTGA